LYETDVELKRNLHSILSHGMINVEMLQEYNLRWLLGAIAQWPITRSTKTLYTGGEHITHQKGIHSQIIL
jgi:hypothetical protein